MPQKLGDEGEIQTLSKNMIFPLGEQNFKEIRLSGKVYVDKTQFIPMLLDNKFFFLSRPRRFGKSLFLSTLESFFAGRKELFQNLAIEHYDWEWKPYPVIRLDFNGADYSKISSLEEKIHSLIDDNQEMLQVDAGQGSVQLRFKNLIRRASKAYNEKVVILVDEYEKALLDVVEDEQILDSHRATLSGLYSVLKAEDEYIRLAFLTGVTRFGHLNIFSGLNNISDISLDSRFTTICGITEDEINRYLQPGVEKLAKAKTITQEEALSELKENYDGYHFSSQLIDVYNPYSLFTALAKGEIDNTWAGSGNSYYLLRQLKNEDFNLIELEGITVDKETLIGYDPDYSDPITLLYQSGYLTIKGTGTRPGSYILGLPNKEVKSALYRAVIPFYLGQKGKLRPTDYEKIATWMENGKAEKFLDWLQQFFSKVTYNARLLPLHDSLQQESDFQFVVFSILSLACGIDKVEMELTTSNGRMDLIVEEEKYIYIFEFKIGDHAKTAIQQIQEKGYAHRWATDGRKIVKIGIAFSPQTRNITDWLIED